MNAIRLWGALAVLLAVLGGSDRAAAQPGNPKVDYDAPLATAKGRVPPGIVEDGGGLTCLSYPQFTLRVIDSGGPGGDLSITIVPKGAGGVSGACSTAAAPGQIVVKTEGQAFAGVKGDFIVLEQSDPYGASRVVVLDRHTGKPRYSDTAFSPANGAITSIGVENDVLRLGYVRGVDGSCSIPQGGQSCFDQIARTSHLPASVKFSKEFFDTCVSTYRSLSMTPDHDSMVTYAVDILVPPAGPPRVISRTAPGCYPLP